MEEAAAPRAGRRMGWWLLPILVLAAFRPTHAEESACDGVCGRRPLAGSHQFLRVVGGNDVLPGTWPWMVSFQVLTREGFTNFCGGSLISPRWVISAAHCFQNPEDIPWIRLSIGANRISDPGPDAQRRSIKRVVNHELYQRILNPSYIRVHNDISLVELNEPVNCTDFIQPACLPDDSMEVFSLGHCYVSGFGIMDSKTKEKPDILQEGYVDLIPKAICSRPDWWSEQIVEENICAGHMEGGVSTCKGDSGGPLMCREQRSERYWLVGITSWGLALCGKEKKPGIYTSTQFYLDWIRQTTNEDLSLPSRIPLMAQQQAAPWPHPPQKPQPQPGEIGNIPYPSPSSEARILRTTPQTPPVVWYMTRPNSRPTWGPEVRGRRPLVFFVPPHKTPPQIELHMLNPPQSEVGSTTGGQDSYNWKWWPPISMSQDQPLEK